MTDNTIKEKSSPWRTVGRIAAKFGITVVEILLLAVIAIYCLGHLAANWPSEHVRGWLASGFNETGVFKKGEPFRFVAHLFYSEAELDYYASSAEEEPIVPETVQVIPYATLPQTTQPGETLPSGPQPDAWGLIDEDGDGSMPNSIVVFKGDIYCAEKGTANGFAGFDSNHKLHVGRFSRQEIRQLDIQYGASFGPVLIKDGVVNTEDIKNGFLNPRTAIGQRSDGAVLLLVIEGRKSSSPGATYQDLADIFQNYGAVNACNMDGGSSAMMYYNGEYLNSSASLIGLRPVPSAFVVLPKGGSDGE